MVAKILGRDVVDLNEKNDKGVVISESNVNNNMLQAYTCVKIKNVLKDYRASVSSTNPSKIVRVKLDDGHSASEIKSVEISWYDGADNLVYNNFVGNTTPKKVVFKPLGTSGGASVPPTISVTMIQTGSSFNLSDFELTKGGQTDRATVFLVPTDDKVGARGKNDGNYIGAYDTGKGKNYIGKSGLLKSNDKTTTNLPYAVYCETGGDYMCSATLELPDAVNTVGGYRNDSTFLFVVSLPYLSKKPAVTNFAMRFCDDSGGCTEQKVLVGGETETVSHEVALKSVQLAIDSTGRANDMFRRVETRLEAGDAGFPYPLYAIQLLGDSNKNLLEKNESVVCEWNFPNRGC